MFPDNLKFGNVDIKLKSGTENSMNNYGPISVDKRKVILKVINGNF